MPLLSAGKEPAKLGLPRTFFRVLPVPMKSRTMYVTTLCEVQMIPPPLITYSEYCGQSQCPWRAGHISTYSHWETGDTGSCQTNNSADYWKINMLQIENRAAMMNNRRGWGVAEYWRSTWRCQITEVTKTKSSLNAPRNVFGLTAHSFTRTLSRAIFVLTSWHFEAPIFKTNLLFEPVRLKNNQLVSKRKAQTSIMDGIFQKKTNRTLHVVGVGPKTQAGFYIGGMVKSIF